MFCAHPRHPRLIGRIPFSCRASNIEQESPLSPSSKKEMPHPQLAGFIPLEGAGYRVKPKVKQSWLGMLPGLVPGWLVSKRPESGAKPAVPAVQISVKAKVHAATESDGTPSASISKKSGKHTLTIGAMKSAEVASPIDQWASQTETKGSIRRRTLENITPPLEVPRESGRRKSTVTTVSTNATIQPYTDEALRDTGSSRRKSTVSVAATSATFQAAGKFKQGRRSFPSE
ncbi:hypothetical protein B484DRAFT_45826 [Ochromonadaceae sp. CCMP2298]|nr:hypothetical protein B484DRAFT_45826 [Ochromonadaceae sp. CCMP2298]